MDTTTWMHVLYTKDITIHNEINFNVFQGLVNGFRVKSDMLPRFLFSASIEARSQTDFDGGNRVNHLFLWGLRRNII